jgi:long-chain acyl-CoA synthetase
VPDATWGEVVHAFVSLKPGAAVPAEALRQFVEQRLADYKVPKAIHLVADLPLGPTGKVYRKTLREWAAHAPEY